MIIKGVSLQETSIMTKYLKSDKKNKYFTSPNLKKNLNFKNINEINAKITIYFDLITNQSEYRHSIKKKIAFELP